MLYATLHVGVDERRDKKSSEHGRKVTIFPRLVRPELAPEPAAESINLCGNFRREPNAERSGYYISPWKSVKG